MVASWWVIQCTGTKADPMFQSNSKTPGVRLIKYSSWKYTSTSLIIHIINHIASYLHTVKTKFIIYFHGKWIRDRFLAPFMIDRAPYHISYILPNNTLFFIFGDKGQYLEVIISQVKVSLYLKIWKQGKTLTPIRCCSL